MESDRLCESIATLVRKVATVNLPGSALRPFLAARLIPLDKGAGGVRPIGIGEVWRRLCGKLGLRVLRERVLEVCGNLQLGGGALGGCEAAIHAAQEAFGKEEVEAICLVDAGNGFNAMNRALVLDDIEKADPAMDPLFRNFYPEETELLLPDSSKIGSVEGSTQGCPLGMPMFGMGTVPMIRGVARDGIRQIWYADDAAGLGKIARVLDWLLQVVAQGKERGVRGQF